MCRSRCGCLIGAGAVGALGRVARWPYFSVSTAEHLPGVEERRRVVRSGRDDPGAPRPHTRPAVGPVTPSQRPHTGRSRHNLGQRPPLWAQWERLFEGTGVSTDLGELKRRLWKAADELRANSGLKASEYASPVLGLIFLRYADDRFAQAAELVGPGSARRPTGSDDYQAAGALYLPEESRFETLLDLPEGGDIGKAINQAMSGIEDYNPDLQGVLPKDYSRIPDDILGELLRLLRALPDAIEGDGFGLIYEYFLGQFAFSEGQKGGEFFTPTSIVRLIVEILEPFHGKIYDPACGSGGMFVQSAHFVERHRQDPSQELSMYGQEKTGDTVRLAKMNLAVHGLGGDIREGNTYYEDLHDSVGQFDFVMANPPFNVNKINKARLEDDPRFPFGLPRSDNGNYLWIQTFYSALNHTGRAGFVMANSASDARGSELEIRRKLILDRSVGVSRHCWNKYVLHRDAPRDAVVSRSRQEAH